MSVVCAKCFVKKSNKTNVLVPGVLAKMMHEHKLNKDCQTVKSRKSTLMRALFTVGLLCKHFDLDSPDMGETKVSTMRWIRIAIFEACNLVNEILAI